MKSVYLSESIILYVAPYLTERQNLDLLVQIEASQCTRRMFPSQSCKQEITADGEGYGGKQGERF